METKDIIQLVDDFINENGMWAEFVAYLRDKGYSTEQLGFPKDDSFDDDDDGETEYDL